jgi:hypothetical protein
MEDKNIFIHIPKTGGTTINTAMHNVYWNTQPDFNYRHIDLKTKKSSSADIFNVNNLDRYKDYNVFTMLREPVDRMISEYYFFKERKEYVKFLRKPPVTFAEYYKNTQTQNYMVGFLVGKRIYDTKPATQQDLDTVLEVIEQLPIHVGIFEHFNQSLGYFKEKTSIEWAKQLEAKRMTFNRPSTSDISDEEKKAILKLNHLDSKLYNHCLAKFETIKSKYDNYKVKFELSKYNHIYPYMAKTCLFEFCLDNKYYIKQNFMFFRDLTFLLIKDMKIRDGETLVKIWNQTVVDSIQKSFPESEFYQEVNTAHLSSDEPLQQLINLAEAINDFFKKDVKNHKKYYKEMKLDKTAVQQPVAVKPKGFLGRLFNKK